MVRLFFFGFSFFFSLLRVFIVKDLTWRSIVGAILRRRLLSSFVALFLFSFWIRISWFLNVLFYLFSPLPHSLKSSFNVIRQRSSMPHRQRHPFNVAYSKYLAHRLLDLTTNTSCFPLIFVSPSNHVFAMSAYVDKLLLHRYISACHHHQRCYIAVNFNAPSSWSSFIHVSPSPLIVRRLTTLLRRTYLF